MLLKIALNGARSKKENTLIPQSLKEIEKEVQILYRIGYKVFHIHCYGEDGKESLKPDDVGNLVSLVKNISPEIQLGISSGDWIEPDFAKRKSYIAAWQIIPDFISVNMIEDNALEVSNLLISKGVLIEAGLNEKKAAQIFAESDLREGCCRILIEPEPEIINNAISVVNEIESILNKYKIKIPRLLHGFNSVSWDMLREAKRRGYDSRIGMEDIIYLENGEKVKSNLEIVMEARKIIETSSQLT